MDLLTLDEVAGLLRVSRHTVYRLASRGEIPGRKVGRHWRFIREDLMQHLRRPGVEGTPWTAPAEGHRCGDPTARQ